MDGCSAGFSSEERAKFLEDGLDTALERIEQESMLRSANIDNLVMCPFCPFAAECCPVEENREFCCQNPECEIVSCRLCRLESHVPLSCDEAAKQRGYSARQQIEEAMSAAMIRKCNKCKMPSS
jgi:TRIAD3 protein (E3 ubiquitin-protein ligase RNF216)